MLLDLILANPAENLTNLIRDWVTPVLFLAFGIMSFVFLKQRQMMAFAGFLLIAVIVAIVFFNPQIIEGIANSVYQESGATGW